MREKINQEALERLAAEGELAGSPVEDAINDETGRILDAIEKKIQQAKVKEKGQVEYD